MRLEIVFESKLLVADFAAEWSFPGVSALMSSKFTFLSEACAAYVAVVGLLTGMHPFVDFEMPFLLEAIVALLAAVGLVGAVHQSVALEVMLPLKALSAQVTTEVCSVAMNPLVDLQNLPRSEAFVAIFALERLHAGMNADMFSQLVRFTKQLSAFLALATLGRGCHELGKTT